MYTERLWFSTIQKLKLSKMSKIRRESPERGQPHADLLNHLGMLFSNYDNVQFTICNLFGQILLTNYKRKKQTE